MSRREAGGGGGGATTSLRERVRAHYDLLTPFYRRFWGDHIHHGYWEADESPEQAQENLVRLLSAKARIEPGSRVLDVGCGVGGSSRWLASELGCTVAGLTLSHRQAVLARDATRSLARDATRSLARDATRSIARDATRSLARAPRGRAAFIQADAARLPVRPSSFDAVWIVECAEHIEDKPGLMRALGGAIRPGGSLAMGGWFSGEGLAAEERRARLAPVLEGMILPSLATIPETTAWMEEAGLEVLEAQDITSRVARTWDVCLEIVRRPFARFLLSRLDADTRRFVGSFEAMKASYESGTMRYGLIAARRYFAPIRSMTISRMMTFGPRSSR